jgi:hypothetical protein
MESDLIQNGRREPGVNKRTRVRKSLEVLKSSKAPELRRIPIALLRYGGKNVITFLMDRFNKILMGEDMLQEWNSAYLCCIYKKGY